MNNKNQFWVFISILIFSTLANHSIIKAQGFSYVYIQGDKKTPIYTKVEGVMMPRYGKNYALLARLAPGPLNVEILFQQNEFPPIQFNILVPVDGKRAFVLQKKGNEFELYDVEQNFYLKANNTINDDHIPGVISNTDLKSTVAIDEQKNEIAISENTNPTVSDEQAISETVATNMDTTTEQIKIVAAPINDTTIVTKEGEIISKPPVFIEEITFDNNRSLDETTVIKEQKETTQEEINAKPTIVNSDCNGAISNLPFLKLSNIISSKSTEDERLGLIIESTKKNCFDTDQCIKMLEKLDSDLAKFTAIKSLYPKTTDQSNFRNVSSVLKAADWKDMFQSFIEPK